MNNNQSGGKDCAVLIKSLINDLTAINRKITHLSTDEVIPAVYVGELSPL